MSEGLICPVSQEKFKEPRVLPCGHTLDDSTIKQLKRKHCPICDDDFSYCSRLLPINWVVVSALQLNITTTKLNKTMTAQEAKKIALIFTDNSVATELEIIYEKIRNEAKSGEFEITHSINNNEKNRNLIVDRVSKKLSTLGFSVSEHQASLCIRWI